MLAVQEKKLKEAIHVLNLVGARYKVITPDGTEYGDLEVKAPRKETTKGGFPRYRHGETREFFKGELSGMKAGDAKVIPCGNYDPRVISRDISSYCCQMVGRESVTVLTDRDNNLVEVLALKDLA